MADLEAEAQELVSGIHAESKSQQTLERLIASAELLMKALRLSKNKDDRLRLNRKCQSMLDRAEKIKSALNNGTSSAGNKSGAGIAPQGKKLTTTPRSIQVLSTKEKVILLESSRVNGFIFPPWDSKPEAVEFDLKEGERKYTDDAVLNLSKLQKKFFDSWKRPEDGFLLFGSSESDQGLGYDSIRMLGTDADLVQDATGDCSVVASLCALITLGKEGLPKILASLIHPYDSDRQCPAISKNGKYILRFYFNGCFRKVVVDDLLPASKTERTLHVIDRRNPKLLWPALVEKAYLKVRGGYDFPGSNSGTDTWILTGWIPEQVFLQSPDNSADQIWRRIHSSFKHGDVLITMGTGRMSSVEEVELGLASQHDYAVLKLRETEGRRYLLVKNPWSDSSGWKNKSQETDLPTLDTETATDISVPGSCWMDLDYIMGNFESMYLNWNPDIFTHRQDVHFTWKVADRSPGSFRTNPQYSIRSGTGGIVWLLLSHHFQSRTESQDESGVGKPESAFISLYAFARNGRRVLSSDGAVFKGPYVDAPQTLLRLDLPPETTYTIVVAQEGLLDTSQRFTLSAFSLSSLTLQPAKDIYTWTSHHSGWTHTTAGGNASSPTYSTNPQFSLHLTSPSSIALLLDTPENDNIPIHLKLIQSGGERITTITSRSIVQDSGDYRRGCAVLEIPTLLDIGKYTIIPSTFEAGQVGRFTLHIGYSSSSPATYSIRPIPSETAGRLNLRLPLAVFASGIHKLRAPLYPQRMTRLRLIARTTQTTRIQSPMKISIEIPSPFGGTSSEMQTLIHSGEEGFNPARGGGGVLRTGDVDLVPEMHRGVWVVLERMSICAGGGGGGDDGTTSLEYEDEKEEDVDIVQVEMLSDAKFEFGTWEIRDS